MDEGAGRKWIVRAWLWILLTVIGLMPVSAHAQSASLYELERMSHKLPGDSALSCVALRAGIAQLDRNVALIDGELTAGRAAMEAYSRTRFTDGPVVVDAMDVDVDAPRDVRVGMKRLLEVQSIAKRRAGWLREVLAKKPCRADVIITDMESPEPLNSVTQ